MSRPPKCRMVEFQPQVTYFKPAGIPKYRLQELVLNVEELEAVRLKDKEGLEQEKCAEKMHVPGQLFKEFSWASEGRLPMLSLKVKLFALKVVIIA